MNSSRFIAAALALVAALQSAAPAAREFGGALSARPVVHTETPATPGRHRVGSAVLYVPQATAADEPAPFLLLLHGAGGKGEDIFRTFKAQADKRGIILLAPNSSGRTWDVALTMGNRWTPPTFGRDVKRIDALLREAFVRVNVDPRRVAVAGFSDGASTALSLGTHNVELFSATLAFSAGGIVPQWNDVPSRVFFAHGTKDPILPIAIARDSLAPALRASGFAVTFEAFDGGHELPGPVLDLAMEWWLRTAQ